MRYVAALANRLGNRTCNQDRARIIERGSAVLLALGDGMGGHARGELASQALMDSLQSTFHEQELPIADPQHFLQQACARAHEEILALGLRQTEPVYPRTTAVVCLLQHNRAWWAHLGDSRLYWVRDGRVLARTRDHTYVEELLRRNAIDEQAAQAHPMRNYVTQCLGGPQEPARASLGEPGDLQIGDQLLLCSDGFWGALNEADWLQRLAEPDLDAALQSLADAAERNAYPNSDNVSALALRLLAAQEVDLEPDDRELEAESGQPRDDLDHAIASIKAAIHRYRHEFDDD